MKRIKKILLPELPKVRINHFSMNSSIEVEILAETSEKAAVMAEHFIDKLTKTTSGKYEDRSVN